MKGYNRFKGSLESLKELRDLFDININNTNIVFSTEDNFPDKLEELYCEVGGTGDFQCKNITEKLKRYYNEDEEFYDIKSLKNKKPRKVKIETIVKIPLRLTEEFGLETERISENYEIEGTIIYDNVYPEADFE
jgi:hypothetical protein